MKQRYSVALATLLLPACGGRLTRAPEDHPSKTPDAAASEATSAESDASATSRPAPPSSKPDASLRADGGRRDVPDASLDASVDAGVEAGEAPDANTCSKSGALTIAGNYVASDQTEHWFRKSATSATYTVVPPGAPTPSALPRLFRIPEVCARWLSLVSPSGEASRLDWVQGVSTLRVCVRAVKDRELVDPDEADDAHGCAGAPWLVLARTSP